MKSNQPTPSTRAFRLAFAALIPALILAWTIVGPVLGLGAKARSISASGPLAARAVGPVSSLYQAVPTPTVEVYNPDTAVAATPTAIPQDEKEMLFEDVWSIVDRNYLYPDYNGADWGKIYDEYSTRVAGASTPQDLYGALVEMVGRLDDVRSAFTPPPQVPMPNAERFRGYANIGAIKVYSDNSLLVLYVYPGGPADKAGIKRRDRITAIEGRPVTEQTREGAALEGLVDTEVGITVRSPAGDTRDLLLKREIVVGKAPVVMRMLGEDPTIGYIQLPSLAGSGIDYRTLYLLNEMQRRSLMQDVPIKGLVLDLRYTSGNSTLTIAAILGQLTQGNLGTFQARNPTDDFDLDIPEGQLYGKFGSVPVVLLVDRGTQGDAEVMAAALQAQGRAKLVGTRTAGNTVANAEYSLKDGSQLTIPRWRFLLPDGSTIEGRGLSPDVTLQEDWTQYSEDNDPYIEAAVSLLHKMGRP